MTARSIAWPIHLAESSIEVILVHQITGNNVPRRAFCGNVSDTGNRRDYFSLRGGMKLKFVSTGISQWFQMRVSLSVLTRENGGGGGGGGSHAWRAESGPAG